MKKLLSFLVPAFVLAAIAATTISTTQSVIRNGFTTSNGVMQAGLSASAGGSNAIAIGSGTDASKSNAIAIGWNALSRGYDSVALGAGATAGLSASNSFAVGPGATVTTADSGVLGVANTAVSVPGTLSVANTLSVGSGSSNPGGIVMASTNGFTSALLSSMQVTNVTTLLASNANAGLSWKTNVSAGSGGTVTQQQIFIPDGTNGQHLAMGSTGPGWVNANMIGTFTFPDGTVPTVSNRKDYHYYVQDWAPDASASSTAIGSRAWRYGKSGGALTASPSAVAGYNSDFIGRLNATNKFNWVLFAELASADTSVFHGSNSQEVLTWDLYLNQAPIFQVTNTYSLVCGLVVNVVSQADPATSGIYWLADTNSTAWQVVYLVGSTYVTNRAESGTIVSNAVLGGVRQRLTTWWKSNTNVVSYINEVPVATNTTIAQIPTGVGLVPGGRFTCLSSNVVGSAAPNLDLHLNYTEFYQQFGNPR